jgi:hypothetical protein
MTKTIGRFPVRIVSGGAIAVIALIPWASAGTSFAARAPAAAPTPASLPVCRRSVATEMCYPDGTVRGVLDLRTVRGELLARGELMQTANDEGFRSRMVFHLANSVIDETVDFIQYGGFILQSYRLVQSGPLFVQDIDATILSSGAYVVSTTSHIDGHSKRYVGNAGLPPEVYHGLAVSITTNPPHNGGETAHIVAFTPQPRLISLELALAGTENMLLGKRDDAVSPVESKASSAAARGLWSRLNGSFRPDSHMWIVTEHLPGFVRYVGPTYSEPVWRLNVMSPSWPQPR